MKIIEVRDGFIKFEANEGIYLSSFVKVDGADKSYVAQVLQTKEDVAFAKILFIYKENQLIPYDKTQPSQDSEIVDFTSEILEQSLKYENPVIVGKTFDNKHNLNFDISAFDKKTVISVDDSNSNNMLVHNLSKQFESLGKKTVIIDMLGIIEAKKYTAGYDFKLPLDSASLRFLYEDCLSDVTPESKSLIVEIFKDLAEYSRTVPFVPFAALKSIVDNMVDKSHIFKLLVLKNKLAKMDKLGYFASKKQETDILSGILNSKCSIIDLSKLDNIFQNRFLSFIFDTLKDNSDTQVILELSNAISKKSLKQVMISDVNTVFATHSNFNYLNDIKNFFDNFIVFPSPNNNQIFRIYATFLKAMKAGSYLTIGEATNYMPFISNIQKIDEVFKENELPSQSDEILEEIAEEASVEDISEDVEENIEEDLEETFVAEPEKQPEVFNAIDEKSEAAINKITSDSEPPETVDLFSEYDEDEDETENGSGEEITEESSVQETTQSAVDKTEETISDEEKDAILSDDTEVEHEDETISDDSYLEQELLDNDSPEADIVEETEPESLILSEEADLEDSLSEVSEETEITENTENSEVSEDVDDTEIQLLKEDDLSYIEQQEEVIDISGVEIDVDTDKTEDTVEELAIENEQETLQQTEENEEEELQIIPISDQNNDDIDFDEIVELDSEEYSEGDIIVDMGDSLPQTVDEEAEERIVQDVDKVFTTVKEDDNISDSDLDFIDELNNDEAEEAMLEEANSDEALLEELAYDEDETGFIQEEAEEEPTEEIKDYEPEILEKRDSSTPIVPVYDAEIPQEDIVESDPIQQGDSVVHAKYGNGIVEKMIKYGNKTLFSINFENIGRRLLDPTLTEIKKH